MIHSDAVRSIQSVRPLQRPRDTVQDTVQDASVPQWHSTPSYARFSRCTRCGCAIQCRTQWHSDTVRRCVIDSVGAHAAASARYSAGHSAGHECPTVAQWHSDTVRHLMIDLVGAPAAASARYSAGQYNRVPPKHSIRRPSRLAAPARVRPPHSHRNIDH
eukprot:26335-Pyramimonas_sp.AAC.1